MILKIYELGFLTKLNYDWDIIITRKGFFSIKYFMVLIEWKQNVKS